MNGSRKVNRVPLTIPRNIKRYQKVYKKKRERKKKLNEKTGFAGFIHDQGTETFEKFLLFKIEPRTPDYRKNVNARVIT